jgi:phosphate-selective porin OprO/OprP
MANNAFGAVAAERRLGATLAYTTEKLNATIGLFGAPEGVQRDATTPDEAYSGNARITWEPILDTGKVVHLGVSGYLATNFAGNTLSNIGDRPNVRVDGGRLVQASIAGTNPATGPQTGAKDATFLGAEAAIVYGPFSVQGEYGHLTVDRFGTAGNVDFDGFYVFGSWFPTGESRSFKGGTIDRLVPINAFDPAKSQWGAVELAVRYDQLNLTDTDLSPLDKKATSWTGAVNWYLNGNLKLLFNYIRFKGENSPLVATPASTFGTTAKGDAFATRLHVDF